MANYIVAKKMSTIALTGGRAFFVPAGFAEEKTMSEAIPVTGSEKISKKFGEIDALLAIKRERQCEGNTIPDTFEYEGRVLDTDKAVEKLLEIHARDIDQFYGVE